MNRALYILLLFSLFIPGEGLAQDDIQSRLKERRIKELVRRLETSRSPKVRLNLAQQLIEMGPAVIPHIVKVQGKYQKRLYIYLYILQSVRKKKKIPYRPPDETPEETFARERIGWIKKALAAGKYKRALDLASALSLLVSPKNKYRSQVTRLKITAEERFIRKYVLAAQFQIDKRIHLQGKVIKVRIVLQNVSKKDVTIIPTATRVVGQVIIQEKKWDLYGNRTQRSLTHVIRLQKKLTLAPKKTWKTSFLIDTRRNSTSSGVLQSYRLRGFFRPRALQTGKKKHNRYLPISPGIELTAVEKPYHLLAGNSLAKFNQALPRLRASAKDLVKCRQRREKLRREIFDLQLDRRRLPPEKDDLAEKFDALLTVRRREVADLDKKIALLEKKAEKATLQVFYAACLVPSPDRRKVIIDLSVALDDTGGKYEKILMVLLSHLTGRPLMYDKKKWIIWVFKKYRFSKSE